MSVVLTVFIILASLLMIGIVLVQKSKGGGLASNFASSNQIMGVRKTTDRKSTRLNSSHMPKSRMPSSA